MNKKGDIFQLLFVLIIVFIVTIMGILFLKLSTQVTQTYNNLNIFGSNNSLASQANQQIQDTSYPTTDYMIFFTFLFANIGVIISAVRTNFSATTMIFFIILLAITVLVASGLVNIYQGFAQSPVLTDVSSHLTLTNVILSKYTPLIMTIFGAIIMLIMFSKSGGDIIT